MSLADLYLAFGTRLSWQSIKYVGRFSANTLPLTPFFCLCPCSLPANIFCQEHFVLFGFQQTSDALRTIQARQKKCKKGKIPVGSCSLLCQDMSVCSKVVRIEVQISALPLAGFKTDLEQVTFLIINFFIYKMEIMRELTSSY